MIPETHHYPPGPESLKPCAVDGEMCQPFPDRDSEVCSWHWYRACWDALMRTRAPMAWPDAEPLMARKKAETKIEVVFEQFTTDAETALLYRILRRRGWSDDRSDAVLAKARWNG